MRRKRGAAVVTIGVALLLLVNACSTSLRGGTTAEPAPTRVVNVLAAASLKEAFEAIGKDFQGAHTSTEVVFNFAGSQQLAQQIREGAPADIFASADAQQMQIAIESGRIAAESPRVFARNRLVVVYPADNPGAILSLSDLATTGIKLVVANENVPAGRYTLEILQAAAREPGYPESFEEAVLANVVSFEENVRSVLNKVVLGEADAGIVYQTDVAPATAEKVGTLDIPDDLNVIAAYPIAALNDAPQKSLAEEFVTMVLSEAGQRTLIDYGFLPGNQ